MTWYLVVMMVTTWDCPWGLGKSPAVVKNLLCSCEQQTTTEAFPRKEAAISAAQKGGTVYEVRGTRLKKLDLKWRLSE